MRLARFLKLIFCAWVLALALFQFSENTADPDLWGHVVFGRQMVRAGTVVKAETFSWTARGEPFLNHEYGFDVIVWKVYSRLGGGTGILLLKTGLGLLVFWLCLKLGGKKKEEGTPPLDPLLLERGEEKKDEIRMAAWGLGALAVVEISFGFPARPQIFTALGIVLTLFGLRAIHRGSLRWMMGMTLLFLVWINIHGGALAGVGLVGLAAGASTLQLWREVEQRKIVVALWFATVCVISVLFCNPWAGELLRWLIGSLMWFRPEIQEWNPAPLGWDHAAFFIVLGVSGFAWGFSRRKRMWWELFVCAAFAILALRSVRNAPLFCIVALATVPPHLEDALARWKFEFSAGLQKLAAGFLTLATAGTLVATFTLHKENPFTMEAPRNSYPMAAVDFMRAHELQGNMLNFFDWGDLVISQLPDCAPSIDGRLDACYSRELIAAHWKFYNGEVFDEKVLPVNDADVALLPVKLAGAVALSKRADWRAVYFDGTAVVLVRKPERFLKLAGLSLPVEGTREASLGRAIFPGTIR